MRNSQRKRFHQKGPLPTLAIYMSPVPFGHVQCSGLRVKDISVSLNQSNTSPSAV